MVVHIQQHQPQQQQQQQQQFRHHPNHANNTTTTNYGMNQPMERLLYNLHYKCCMFALQTTSRTSRSYAEHTILIIAICNFGALLLLHRTFIFYPSYYYYYNNYNNVNINQIPDISTSINNDTLYNTQNINNITNLFDHQNNNNKNKVPTNANYYIPTQCLRSIPGFIDNPYDIDVTHIILMENDRYSSSSGSSRPCNSTSSSTTTTSSRSNSYVIVHNTLSLFTNDDDDDDETNSKTTDSSCTMIDDTVDQNALHEQQCSSNDVDDITSSGDHNCRSISDPTTTHRSSDNHRSENNIMYSFAREKGYLYLSTDHYQYNHHHRQQQHHSKNNHHNIRVQYVYISKNDINCFGEPFVQYLIFHLLYGSIDTVIINWLIGTFYNTTTTTTTITTGNKNNNNKNNNGGFIYNPQTDVVIDLNEYKQQQQSSYYYYYYYDTDYERMNQNSNNLSKHWSIRLILLLRKKLYELLLKGIVVIKTCFLFFITTTLVSFTLRETQGRMLQFTHTLQQQFQNQNNNNNNTSIILHLIITHVIENVIFVPIILGFTYFLINFYNGNKFLAFSVLGLVWICESFSIVSLRTEQGIKYFPLFFFLLFALFHYYHISFPYGFSYAALTTSMCFMMHSMLFFWHRYELPAVFLGHVNPEHFRDVSGYGINRNNNIGRTVSPPPPPPPPTPPHPIPIVPSTVQFDEHNNGDDTMIRRQAPPSATTHTHETAPAAPIINFERLNVARTQSFNTFASGRLSRNSSNNGMYHRGDEEDDESSYIYFMGGEVVIPPQNHHHNHHRRPEHGSNSNNSSEHSQQRATSPYNTNSEYVPPPTNPTSRVESASSSLSLASSVAVVGSISNSESSRSRRERFVNELEPVVASAISMDDDTEQVFTNNSTAITPDTASSQGSNPNEQLTYSDGNTPSTLQEIVNVMDNVEIASSQHLDDIDGDDTVGCINPSDSIFR